jgi:hypothetical protein
MRADLRLFALLALHELELIARRPALAAGVALHVGVLGGFVISWGDGRGVPMLAPRTIYEQLRLIQVPLLALLLPWAGSRSIVGSCDGLVRLSAATGVRPAVLVGAKALALTVVLAMIAVAGLPVAILASRMSVTESTALSVDEAAVFGVALAAAAVCLACSLTVRPRVAAWAVATLTLLSLVFASLNTLPSPASSPASAGVVAMAAGALAMASLIAVADRRLRYLSEFRA